MKAARIKAEARYKWTLITVAQAEKVLKDKPKVLKRLLGNVEQKEGKIGVVLASECVEEYIPPAPEFDDLDALEASNSAEDLA